MKIRELIEMLISLEEKFGNVNVYIKFPDSYVAISNYEAVSKNNVVIAVPENK